VTARLETIFNNTLSILNKIPPAAHVHAAHIINMQVTPKTRTAYTTKTTLDRLVNMLVNELKIVHFNELFYVDKFNKPNDLCEQRKTSTSKH
jgi:hypothetical protein